MSSQHSDDQTARSRPLPARQSPEPFALHTCGVTTSFTRHTDSYRTLPVHHYPFGHAPHALQEGRKLRSSSGRLARSATTLKEKRLAAQAPASPLRISESVSPSPAPQTSLRSSCLATAANTAAPHFRKIAAPPVAVPAPGQPPVARTPDRSHRQAVQVVSITAYDGIPASFPAADSFRSPGSENPPERHCRTPARRNPPAPSSPVRRAGLDSPIGPRRRFPALPPLADRAK
jgi:hypothetical protein